MELLATNQPWNLIIFMAIPVILAETIAIAELYILYTRDFSSIAKKISRVAGTIVGIYFAGVFIYLFKNAVIPITAAGEWRTFADVIAVGSYLLGVIPLFGMTLLELKLVWKNRSDMDRLKLHAGFVAIFLVVAHIAMIFGMLSPAVFSGGHGGGMTM